MQKVPIKQIEDSFCYINSLGGLFLVSNYQCQYFDNLDVALKKTRENIIDLFSEKEVFFKSLTDFSEEKIESIIKDIRQFSYSIFQNNDLSYFLETNKGKFFKILRDIESIKWQYRQENNPNVSAIIDCRNQLVSLFVQMDKLAEVKKINDLILKKIDSDLFRWREELKKTKEKKLDSVTRFFLEQKMTNLNLYLDEVTFVNPYKEKFESLQNLLEKIDFKSIDNLNFDYLNKEIIKVSEKF